MLKVAKVCGVFDFTGELEAVIPVWNCHRRRMAAEPISDYNGKLGRAYEVGYNGSLQFEEAKPDEIIWLPSFSKEDLNAAKNAMRYLVFQMNFDKYDIEMLESWGYFGNLDVWSVWTELKG